MKKTRWLWLHSTLSPNLSKVPIKANALLCGKRAPSRASMVIAVLSELTRVILQLTRSTMTWYLLLPSLARAGSLQTKRLRSLTRVDLLSSASELQLSYMTSSNARAKKIATIKWASRAPLVSSRHRIVTLSTTLGESVQAKISTWSGSSKMHFWRIE